jgi:choline-sulfatase
MSRSKPNFLVIMVDQLSALRLKAYGHKVVKTPTLDRLAETGIVFESAYSPSPLCAPARAIFMSGLLPSHTGVYDNAAEFPSAIPTFAHYLRLEGYKTCLSGKMHFVGPDQLHGLEERLTTDIYPADFGWTADWRLKQERIDWWYHNMTSVKQAGIAEITNQIEYDDDVAFQATRRIYDQARYDRDTPLCLVVSFSHPHDPYASPARFWNLYRDSDIDAPAVGPIPYDDLDPHSRRLYGAAAMDDYDITPEDVLSSRHGYYANISYLDDKIAGLLATLETTGMAEDTIVVFTSDHGDFLGERGLWYKMSFLEPAARVPLIVHNPARFRARRVATPASVADVMPTLVELARGQCGRARQPRLGPQPRAVARRRGGGSRDHRPWRVPGRSSRGADVHDPAGQTGSSSAARPIRTSCSISRAIPTNWSTSPGSPSTRTKSRLSAPKRPNAGTRRRSPNR